MAIKRYFKFLACFLVFLTVTSASGIYANINNGTTDENNVIYVSINGNDTNDGLTLNTSKKSIQNAINNADNGTKIIISPGTYKENLKISNINVTLTSNQPKKTIINGQLNDICITIYRGCNVTINGLTITNGRGILVGEGINPHRYGGGVWTEGDLTLTNSIITKNTADYGAGIYNSYPPDSHTVNITNCIITKNLACSGAGIYNKGTMNIACSNITHNNAKYCEGGGITNRGGEVAVNYCNIRYNTAKWGGGGVYNGCEKDSFCSVNHCNITYNKGSNGGGLHNGEGMRVANSRIISNRADDGGGVFNLIII